MEGLLCQWALAMQEFDKGSQYGNADALSRGASSTSVVTATQFATDLIKEDIQQA